MSFTIISKNNEKTFTEKSVVNIGSKPEYDYTLDTGFDFNLTIQFDQRLNKYILLNPYGNKRFLFKGEPCPARIEIDKVCKIMINGSDEYLTIKILDIPRTIVQKFSKNTSIESDVEKRKNEIESARIPIIKQVGAKISELRRKISINSKGGIFLHITLFLASFICAFGVSNYLTGLPIDNTGEALQMPMNVKLVLIFSCIIYAIGIMLKQGIYLLLCNKAGIGNSATGFAEKFMICLSLIFYVGIYFINVLYYLTPKTSPAFAVLGSIFFVGTCMTLALSCGYFKYGSEQIRIELDSYEYREDFEHVIKAYQNWIESFASSIADSKINKIRDKLFNLQIKSAGEIILGILTAPFLAYGVSNTLAMCFPEAAGWIRISNLRLSPVFLVLATFLIIFAFFNFANGFFCGKKVQASNVIKQDGFSNFMQHGVEIFGLEGVKKLDIEMRRSFIIGLSIIFIEFSMNVSFFMQSIGGDLSGMLLSAVAALVPTALLIAETFMLSTTKFEVYACEGLLEKSDR